MLLPGFVGPTFQSQSYGADVERCLNLYPEIEEGGSAKAKIILLATPGLTALMTLPDSPIRGMFASDGRSFCVAGSSFFEITGTGSSSYTKYGTVANDGGRVWFAQGPRQYNTGAQQLMIVSGGAVYVFTLSNNTFAQVTAGSLLTTVSGALCFDGYFFVFGTSANQQNIFQISSQYDATAWSGLDIQARFEGSDNIQMIGASQRAIWLLGTRTSEAWYNSGSANFPFAPIPGVFIEEGLAAPASLATQVDNTLLWLGRNQNGACIARRATGYTPMRISTHGVEAQWDAYSTVTDAVGWTYREQGHEFWVITFPTAQATWVWDAATQMWHERAYLNPVTGLYEAHLGIAHCFNFGMHLVGDRQSGIVYQQAVGIYTDNGHPIVSMRRAPYIGNEDLWMFHSKFELEFDRGAGTATGQGQNPLAMLRWSNDGRTWSNQYTAPIGAMGNYGTRAIWRRLGRARWRNYEVTISDPVRRSLINAYIGVTPGTS